MSKLFHFIHLGNQFFIKMCIFSILNVEPLSVYSTEFRSRPSFEMVTDGHRLGESVVAQVCWLHERRHR